MCSNTVPPSSGSRVSNSVIVWDQNDDAPHGMNDVLCWQSYASGDRVSSIPRYLEHHAERLRARYLAFIHDLGESRVNGRRIVEHLDIGDGFSFWWMTHLAEKSPFKSPRIYDCLRLMALEEILLERKPVELTLNSSDGTLARAVENLCRNLAIQFIWQSGGQSKRSWTLREFYRVLPGPLQCLITLGRYLVTRGPLRNLQKPQWFFDDKAVFICSYFFALDEASCAMGRFYSRQWEALPNLLHDTGRRTNWVQLFLFSLDPGARTAINWVRRFNGDAVRQGCHMFLDSYLSWKIVARVLRRLVWLNTVAWRLRRVRLAFSQKGFAVWLWPFLEYDWRTSLNGPIALCNCLWVELFDAALNDIPHQNIGLYLCENQSWERALLRAWRRHGHGEIIAVQHAAVAFWYLNYFDDPRSLTSKESCAIPLPNRVAVNGPMAWKAFSDMGYPVEQLVGVEALRYQHLATVRSDNCKKRTRYSKSDENLHDRSSRSVLILGDFTTARTIKMLRCVEAALHLLNSSVSFTLKNHPACRLSPSDHVGSFVQSIDKPLSEILGAFDYAFISNTTSASLEAYLYGLKVLVFVDPSDLNLSPLRDVEGVRFISAPKELATALWANGGDDPSPVLDAFFWLDTDLPRWRELLSEAEIRR